MENHQKSHVISIFLTVSRFVEEIEEIAVEGRSPSGMGQVLSPLPKEDWQRICVPLKRLMNECKCAAKALSPIELKEQLTEAPLSTTLTWLSVMLGKIEETLEELRPEIMEPRFGEIPAEVREILAASACRALSTLGESRKALQSIREGGK